MKLTSQLHRQFADHLFRLEKSDATREKYLRDVQNLTRFTQGQPLTKEMILAWKKHLTTRYAVRSVNSMLAGVNCLLEFLGLAELKVKSMRTQKQTYCTEELTKGEYLRLLGAAGKNTQLYFVLQTICATGIRVSELRYFTVESLKQGQITVDCKNKTRTILIPGKLKNMLLNFAQSRAIKTGPVFVTKTGRQLDRSNIWSAMKKLCEKAGVKASKVFPHNLRKLFARTFYRMEKDIAKLADILGHSSINTTRIYIMTTAHEHLQKIEQLHLLL